MNLFLGSVKKLKRFQRFSRHFFTLPKKLADYWDHATGVERWESLQFAKGNPDPWLMMPIKRGPGTKDCPNIIPSVYDKRIVGCFCTDDTGHVVYWWLHEGFPRRCKCNHWFVLQRVPLPKIYEDC